MDDKPYTDRVVVVTPIPRERAMRHVEPLHDVLTEWLWEHWWVRVRCLSIASHAGITEVAGWPPYVPAWVARRIIANAADRCHLTADVTYVVRRCTFQRGD